MAFSDILRIKVTPFLTPSCPSPQLNLSLLPATCVLLSIHEMALLLVPRFPQLGDYLSVLCPCGSKRGSQSPFPPQVHV